MAHWGLSHQKQTSYNVCVNIALYFSAGGVTRSRVKYNRLRKNESYVHRKTRFVMATGLKNWSHEEVRRVIRFQWKEGFPHRNSPSTDRGARRLRNESAKCQKMLQGDRKWSNGPDGPAHQG